MTRWSALLPAAVQSLREAGVPDAAGDARVLLAHAARVSPDRLTLHLADEATDAGVAAFQDLIRRRAAREPVSHLTGRRLFWGRSFTVTAAVLDPRPETETLIAIALAEPFSHVLDLGLGSGCILFTLLAERPDARGVGVDLSEHALSVAQANAGALGVSGRVAMHKGSWFNPVDGQFDLIVSNPPYIARDEMTGLSPEVRDHEPRVALTDEGDGLSAYRTITAGALPHLMPGGRLAVEIGPTQGTEVARLFRLAGLQEVEIRPDLDGRDRVVLGRAP